jgi:succinate dehydrogenase / fumarate reductase iron-sulfur subunit
MSKTMNLTLHVWRQKSPSDMGGFETYPVKDIDEHMSFLEMLDVVNERLLDDGKDPIAFDSDCREGICGMCGLVINGMPHGPNSATTTCQLHMRHYSDGDEITIEPWRAGPFPVIKDLIVDRGAFDRIIQAGGYVSVSSGAAPEANGLPVPKQDAERSIEKQKSDLAMDAAACIGCGACVAACPNASAMLFVAAKVVHLGLLPQGQPERAARVRNMVAQMDAEGFGHCTNHYECMAACPKEIDVEFIARMNRDLMRSVLFEKDHEDKGGGAG